MADGVASFGRWLKQQRKDLGFTQKEVASCTGCSTITVRKMEADDYRPSTQIAERLADCLEVSPGEHEAFVKFARQARQQKQAPSAHAGRLPILGNRHHSHWPGSLPGRLTSVVGREQELAVASNLLLHSEVHLLTLTGPPGIGKTLLSLELGRVLRDHFEDGVFFIPLASITDPNMVGSTIALSLGIKEAGNRPPMDRLARYLGSKSLLLILDNFEQVGAAAPLLSEVMSTCPRLKLMVTSRELLRIRGEYQFRVPPLRVPDVGHLPPPEELSAYPSVQLFVERARAVKPDFALSAQNASAVAALCAHLDGLPLAIEIAAARTNIFSPMEMQARLSNRLKLLTGGARDLPPRQQTLRSAIDWSYDLLSAGEQTLFARLGVFAGGCTLPATEAVCKATGDLIIDVMDGVESLLDKSLLRGEEQTDGERRMAMLETIHEYALERLEVSAELESARRHHAEYYLALAVAADPELTGRDQSAWLALLGREHENMRAALKWSLGVGIGEGAEKARRKGEREALREGKQEGERQNLERAEVGMRLCIALVQFWTIHGHDSEGRKWVEMALLNTERELSVPLPELGPLRAKLLSAAGWMAWEQSDYAVARRFHEASLALRRKLGDRRGISASLNNLGNVALDQGDYIEARRFHEASLAIKRKLSDEWGISMSLNNLGLVARGEGDDTWAHALMEESLAVCRKLGDKMGISRALDNLGIVARNQGDYARARRLHEESVAIRRELGSKTMAAYSQTNLACVATDQGDYGEAFSLFSEALLVLQEAGDRRVVAECLEGLGEVAAASTGANAGMGTDVKAKGSSVGAECERAAALFGAAEVLREETGARVAPADCVRHQRYLAIAQAALGEEIAWDAAWTRGRAMTMQEAIEYALELNANK